MALTLNATTATSMASTLATALGTGSTIKIYTGAKPATPETAATGTLLATVTISGSWTASAHAITAADPAAVTAVASGTAGYFRIATSGGTGQIDGTVGTTGADMNLSSTSIVSGGSIDLGVPTVTVPII